MGETAEKQDDRELKQMLDHYGVRLRDDAVVDWQDDSKDKPRNWAPWKKFYNALLISWLEMLMTGISTAGVSACESFTRSCRLTVFSRHRQRTVPTPSMASA